MNPEREPLLTQVMVAPFDTGDVGLLIQVMLDNLLVQVALHLPFDTGDAGAAAAA